MSIWDDTKLGSAKPTTPLSAKERTQAITKAVIGWLIRRNFSCHVEVGVLPWGSRRVDLVAMNTKRHLIGIEVKQCWADFANDKKVTEYLPFFNQFYFAFPYDLWEKRGVEILARVPKEMGVVVLGRNGLVSVLKNGSTRQIEHETKRDIVTRLAWRGGTSRRTTRRYRVYL